MMAALPGNLPSAFFARRWSFASSRVGSVHSCMQGGDGSTVWQRPAQTWQRRFANEPCSCRRLDVKSEFVRWAECAPAPCGDSSGMQTTEDGDQIVCSVNPDLAEQSQELLWNQWPG